MMGDWSSPLYAASIVPVVGSIIAQLKSRGIEIAFVRHFWGGEAKPIIFEISHGFGDWGTATAIVSDKMKSAPGAAHTNYGKIFMMPVDPNSTDPRVPCIGRPATVRHFECLDELHQWRRGLGPTRDVERFLGSSQIEPYTDAPCKRTIGTGFYDLNAYYATWFLLGNQPPITHDVLYYFYRREPSNAAAPAQSMPIAL